MQIIDQPTTNYWIGNLSILVCVVKPDRAQQAQGLGQAKEIPSTEGMALSLETSELMAARIKENLPEKHIDELIKAIEEKNFTEFVRIVIKESN